MKLVFIYLSKEGISSIEMQLQTMVNKKDSQVDFI